MKKNRNYFSIVTKAITYIAAFITFGVVISMLGYIIIKGVPNISSEMFRLNNLNISIIPALINTLLTIIIALLISVPIGIASAIYLVEYAKPGSKIVKVISVTIETLAAIPSIVYGLFGFLFFAIRLEMGYSLLGGALTLAIMVLPLIIRTTEQSLQAIPDAYRNASYGLGAGKLRTVMVVVLPAALSGILGGVILSIGRIVGETAALMYTAGTVSKVPTSILDSGRTLSVHMYVLLSEGLYIDEAYGVALILLILVFGINLLSKKIGNKLIGGKNGNKN